MFDFRQVALFKTLFVPASMADEIPEFKPTKSILRPGMLPGLRETGRRNSFSLPRPQMNPDEIGTQWFRPVKGRRSLLATLDNPASSRTRESIDSLSADGDNKSDIEPFSPKKHISQPVSTEERSKRPRGGTIAFKVITEIAKSTPKEDTKILSHSTTVTDVI